MSESKLRLLDLKLNWHPCSQMKDYEIFESLIINKAYDCYLELSNGDKIIDGISSWWCKSLGHNHPSLKDALLKQINKFEHVIFANTTNETIISLSDELTKMMPMAQKVFYAGDGSCAIEIAIKMSFHSRMIMQENKRVKFIALRNGYHGETLGAMSVSDIGIYKDVYKKLLFEGIFIDPVYVHGKNDPKWLDIDEYWNKTLKLLEPYSETATAIIVEPILQGAGGMLIYSKTFLEKLCAWAKDNNIHIIADEIMTGFGRTGRMLAFEYISVQPDFICLSKGLTSGWLPFSAVLTTNRIYNIFYDDYEKGKSFLHSHTYSGSVLGASLALETLKIFSKQNICNRVANMENTLIKNMQEISNETGLIQNIRGIGSVVAADLVINNEHLRHGFKVYQEATKRGLLLRPLGNTIYWAPPLIASEDILSRIKMITQEAILSSY
ncbi:MAG: adenosylmethionine--8-amino-7-oxononanoate transaminase [Legionellales bacterium]|nr:adenosylmethionine--8-amino-7-oxononanoate transaminase [Legionellales bacterium]